MTSSRATGPAATFDTIITAIGYRYNRSLLVDRIVGDERAHARARSGTTPRAPTSAQPVPGFPNMFILLGPNSIGINSVIFSLEAQIAYVMDALRDDGARRRRRLEVRPEALDGFVDEVRSPQRAAASGPTAAARPTTSTTTAATSRIYPGFAAEFRRRTRRFDPAPYTLSRTADREPVSG